MQIRIIQYISCHHKTEEIKILFLQITLQIQFNKIMQKLGKKKTKFLFRK